MDNNTSVENDLEMRISGRNKDRTMVIVDKSSKLSLFDNSKKRKERAIAEDVVPLYQFILHQQELL